MNAVDDARTRLDTICRSLNDLHGALLYARAAFDQLIDEAERAADAEIVDEQVTPAAPAGGEWVTVRPDDERIVAGSRVRLGGVEGEALRFPRRLRACGPSRELWSADHGDGPDVELWVPTEVTLPLPTEPGPFWGRVERDGETYTGWVWRSLVGNYITPRDVGCFRAHHAEHITRLPLPDAEREALR